MVNKCVIEEISLFKTELKYFPVYFLPTRVVDTTFFRLADCQKTAARIKYLKEEIRNLKLKLAKVYFSFRCYKMKSILEVNAFY